MLRKYICKKCGEVWETTSRYADYYQECPVCGSNTRPEKPPEKVHYAIRGDPYYALCNQDILAEMENFQLKNVTCPDCLEILATGKRLMNKCHYCKNFRHADNRPDWAWCNANPRPEDMEFNPVAKPYLTLTGIDKGCNTQFEYKRKWKNFFRKKLENYIYGQK